jgi:hypothetical protein
MIWRWLKYQWLTRFWRAYLRHERRYRQYERGKDVAELEAWRRQMTVGVCDKCHGRMYVAHGASSRGSDLIMCENQYGGYHAHILGSGRCQNIADLSLLNERAKLLGVPELIPM